MSTIHASNFGDGTNTVESGYVLNGTIKAWGACNAAGASQYSGTFNVSSITDSGTNGKDFSITSSFLNTPICSLGGDHISKWGNNQGFIWVGGAGISTAMVSVNYYNGSAYIDSPGSFKAIGDLA